MRHLTLSLLIGVAVAAGNARAADDWPQWRGPSLNGVVEAENLPVEWSADKNIVWRIEMPVWSGSTPVVWGDRIFLASPEKSPAVAESSAEGRRRTRYRDPGGEGLYLHCLSLEDGREIWKRPVGSGNYFKMKQNMSSPSPVTDGEHVWALTGTGELTGFDFDGNVIWKRDIQKEYGVFGLNHGFASSTLLYENLLIVPVLHGMKTTAPSYLLALDKLTGKEVWRTERPHEAILESPDSYVTPQLLMHEGKAQIVTNGADIVTAHDMATGAELWRVTGLNPKAISSNRTIGSSVVVGDMVLSPGNRGKMLLRIEPGGSGDVTDSHVRWISERASDVPCVVSDGKYVWVVNDRGTFTCLDAETGEELYEKPQRLATGTYSSSPVLADGKIYAMNEMATVTVLEAGPEFKILATNELDGGYTLSSPVIVGDRIYLRTSDYLYCIAQGGGS